MRAADREAARLREEVAQLHEALASRPVIEQAMDVVATLASCEAATAWKILVRVSQSTNTKVRAIAAQLVAAAAAGRPCVPRSRPPSPRRSTVAPRPA